MAAGDSTLVATLTRSQYEAQNAKLIGQMFDDQLDISMSNANILAQLEGPQDSDKPFVVKQDLTKKGADTINFTVATSLGSAGRRGTQRAVNYEEQLIHNSWPVKIDNLRITVAWSRLVDWAAASGMTWQAAYPLMLGKRLGQIQQEDAFCRLRQRSSVFNTVRPGNRASLDTITYADTLDTSTLGRALGLLKHNGATPASIGTMTGGMELKRFVCLGTNLGLEGLWQDPTFTNALSYAQLRGDTNPYWTDDLPNWRGMTIKRWDNCNPDNPGPGGSTLNPEASLGDAITTATTTFNLYGGSRTQATLADSAGIYKPFELFYGCDKLLGESISTGSDTNVYYFVVIDPTDGKWCLYSYTGSAAFGANGQYITITNRLASASTGAALTTLGNVTYSSLVNKTAFPTGSLILQVNANAVPICDTFLFGANVGAKCYGYVKAQPIMQKYDYEAENGIGVWSIYGQDVAIDVNGNYYRRHVRLQSAYEHPLGALLPTL